MAPSMNDVMDLVMTISQQEEIKVTVNKSLIGSLYAAGGAFVGGLLGGGPGLFVGWLNVYCVLFI